MKRWLGNMHGGSLAKARSLIYHYMHSKVEASFRTPPASCTIPSCTAVVTGKEAFLARHSRRMFRDGTTPASLSRKSVTITATCFKRNRNSKFARQLGAHFAPGLAFKRESLALLRFSLDFICFDFDFTMILTGTWDLLGPPQDLPGTS